MSFFIKVHMWKILWFILALILCSILGCYPNGDGMECFGKDRYASLNFLTTTPVDSVQFYLDEQRICYGDVGHYYKLVVCKSLTTDADVASDFFSEKCMASEKEKTWTIFHCYVGEPFDGVVVSSKELRVKVFSTNREKIDIPLGSLGGLITNVFPERDSAEWFGYRDNPIRPFLDDFYSPALSMRKGCFNGFCVASLPMADEEVCYDK